MLLNIRVVFLTSAVAVLEMSVTRRSLSCPRCPVSQSGERGGHPSNYNFIEIYFRINFNTAYLQVR
jgi:hypothetical protein